MSADRPITPDRAAGTVVGFVGLGNMGAPMVARLLAARHVVRGFDPAADAAGELAGIDGFTRVGALVEVASGADAVILMLPSSDVVEQVMIAERLLATMIAGTLLIDMSSSEPLRTCLLATQASELGIELIDAPVSGGVSGAREGSLTIMVGGPDQGVRTALPLLEGMGGRVTHVGEVGAGHALKALNNLMSASHLLVSSEALLTARRFGLDLDLALEVINASSGRSGSTEVKWPTFVLPGGYDSGFGMGLMVKDMRTALGLAHGVGTPTALSERAVELWALAAEQLPPEADHTEIVRWLEQQIDAGPVR